MDEYIKIAILILICGYIGAWAGLRKMTILTLGIVGLVSVPYIILRFFKQVSIYLYPYIEKPLADGSTIIVMIAAILVMIGYLGINVNFFLSENLRSRELDKSMGTIIGISVGLILGKLL